MGDLISEATTHTRTVNIFLITVLVVITDGGMQGRADEIADTQPIGVECTSVINTVQPLLYIANRNEALAVEGPAVGDSFCIQCDLLEADGLLVGDVHACIGITRFQ